MGTWTIDRPRQLSFDDDVRQLRLRTIRGTVSVVGTDGPARLEVTEIVGDGLVVRQSPDGTLDVGYDDWSIPRGPIAFWLKRGKWRRKAVVSLAVPRDCSVDLGVIAGPVMVSGLKDRVYVRVISGDITLTRLDGPVDTDTVSGSIEAHGVSGTLRMHTISGDLTLVEGTGSTVYADTTSGSVTCDLTQEMIGNVRLSSVSGEIVIRAPETSDMRVHLQATSGRTASDFTQLSRHGVPGMFITSGILGAGTGELWATTVSGHVSLLCRDSTHTADISNGSPEEES